MNPPQATPIPARRGGRRGPASSGSATPPRAGPRTSAPVPRPRRRLSSTLYVVRSAAPATWLMLRGDRRTAVGRLTDVAVHLAGGGCLLLHRRGDGGLELVDLADDLADLGDRGHRALGVGLDGRHSTGDVLGRLGGLLSQVLDLAATTAKPLPASPARAASMVALRASRLVCSAIEVIILTTLPISADDSPSLATGVVGGRRHVTAREATRAPSLALLAISWIDSTHLAGPGGHGLHVLRHLLGRGGGLGSPGCSPRARCRGWPRWPRSSRPELAVSRSAFCGQGGDRRPDAGRGPVDAGGHRAHLVGGADVDGPGEVTVGDRLDHVGDLAQRPDDPVGDQDRQGQRDGQTDQQGDHDDDPGALVGAPGPRRRSAAARALSPAAIAPTASSNCCTTR